jgi:phage/plasmid-associated DNA primase
MGSDDEGKCKRALEERNQARLMALNRHKKRYEKLRKRAKPSMQKIEENYNKKELRNFYQGAKKSREARQKRKTDVRPKEERGIDRKSGRETKEVGGVLSSGFLNRPVPRRI